MQSFTYSSTPAITSRPSTLSGGRILLSGSSSLIVLPESDDETPGSRAVPGGGAPMTKDAAKPMISPLRRALAQRVTNLHAGEEESAFLKLLRLSAKAEIRLSRGDPALPAAAHVLEAGQRALGRGETKYTPHAR